MQTALRSSEKLLEVGDCRTEKSDFEAVSSSYVLIFHHASSSLQENELPLATNCEKAVGGGGKSKPMILSGSNCSAVTTWLGEDSMSWCVRSLDEAYPTAFDGMGGS